MLLIRLSGWTAAVFVMVSLAKNSLFAYQFWSKIYQAHTSDMKQANGKLLAIDNYAVAKIRQSKTRRTGCL